MVEPSPSPSPEHPSKGRMLLGAVVLVAGQCLTVFLPAIAESGFSVEMKGFLAGALYFVLPELCFMAAVAIWGKPGFELIKGTALGFLGRMVPSAVVGGARYRVGLAMFVVPIVLAWLAPFLARADGSPVVTLPVAVAGDVVFVSSFFVLGGEFWDKFRALFVPGAVASFPAAARES